MNNNTNNIFKITLLISLFFSISAFTNSASEIDTRNNTKNNDSELLEVSDLVEAIDYLTKALYRYSHAAASSYYSNMLNSSYLKYEPVAELGDLALWNPMMNVILQRSIGYEEFLYAYNTGVK